MHVECVPQGPWACLHSRARSGPSTEPSIPGCARGPAVCCEGCDVRECSALERACISAVCQILPIFRCHSDVCQEASAGIVLSDQWKGGGAALISLVQHAAFGLWTFLIVLLSGDATFYSAGAALHFMVGKKKR